MLKVSLYTNMYNSTLMQASVEQVMMNDKSFCEDMRNEYKQRRDILYEELNKIKSVRVTKGEGGMYLWVDFRGVSMNDRSLAELLRVRGKVVIIPGSCFGESGRGFARISLSADVKILREAAKKIQICLDEIILQNALGKI